MALRLKRCAWASEVPIKHFLNQFRGLPDIYYFSILMFGRMYKRYEKIKETLPLLSGTSSVEIIKLKYKT